MTTAVTVQTRMPFMNPSVPIHAQLQYQSLQSQPPTYHYRPQLRMPQPAPAPAPGEVGFDGKMLRKAMARKTVDYNPSVVRYLENRVIQRDYVDVQLLQPDILYCPYLVPPQGMLDNPINCVMTKFIRPATNKNRCPIFCVCWTPDGRRLITGASSGEFTLWNGLTFNFETILQAHESSVRAMVWSHNEQWMLTGDHSGFVKYWQSNMNNVKMYQVHKEPVRGLSFCPSDVKYASCSDDSTVRIFDFIKCQEELILRGHGSDVKCVDWHPYRGIVISGSKDSQQPIIMWDPRSGKKLSTLHAHKNTCTDLKWNPFNGNWLISASRDHLCKLFDIRNLKKEFQSFRGHKKEACTLAWHPIHEKLFASGGSDGSLYFWLVGTEKELAGMDDAHDGMIWDLSWHPLGHMLVSGSNDHTTRFWTRNRPGDTVIDKSEECVVIPKSEMLIFHRDNENSDEVAMPGLGLEKDLLDKLKAQVIKEDVQIREGSIPGLDVSEDEDQKKRKGPYSKPIPKPFERAWKSGKSVSQPLLPVPSSYPPPDKQFNKPAPAWQQTINAPLPQINQPIIPRPPFDQRPETIPFFPPNMPNTSNPRVPLQSPLPPENFPNFISPVPPGPEMQPPRNFMPPNLVPNAPPFVPNICPDFPQNFMRPKVEIMNRPELPFPMKPQIQGFPAVQENVPPPNADWVSSQQGYFVNSNEPFPGNTSHQHSQHQDIAERSSFHDAPAELSNPMGFQEQFANENVSYQTETHYKETFYDRQDVTMAPRIIETGNSGNFMPDKNVDQQFQFDNNMPNVNIDERHNQPNNHGFESNEFGFSRYHEDRPPLSYSHESHQTFHGPTCDEDNYSESENYSSYSTFANYPSNEDQPWSEQHGDDYNDDYNDDSYAWGNAEQSTEPNLLNEEFDVTWPPKDQNQWESDSYSYQDESHFSGNFRGNMLRNDRWDHSHFHQRQMDSRKRMRLDDFRGSRGFSRMRFMGRRRPR